MSNSAHDKSLKETPIIDFALPKIDGLICQVFVLALVSGSDCESVL